MTTARDVIQKKLLICGKVRKRKDLLTEAEDRALRECRTSELFRIESNPFRLGKICEGEKMQVAAFYDAQEAKYRRAVSKINRRVLPKPRDAVPPPRPIERPIEAISRPVSAIQEMEMDVAIDAGAVAPPVTPAPDIYQLQEQLPVSGPRSDHELMLEGLEEDNFGIEEGDGMRDFLEMCTGTELPPMAMGDESSLKLLLNQLPSMSRPTLPVENNFRELNIDEVLSQLDYPGTARTDALTPPNVIPALPYPEAFGGDSLDNLQQLPVLASVPVVQSPPPEAPAERPQSVPALEPVEAVSPGPARTVRRQPRTFTDSLPLLATTFSLLRNRITFDIFSCYYDSNVDWTIERLQNRLFEQRVASPLQPQPLLTTDLSAIRPYDSMSIDAQRQITGDAVEGNVSEGSRENPLLPFMDRTDPQGQSSNLRDATRAHETDALETPVGVASILAPESLPPLPPLPTVEQPILPELTDGEMMPHKHAPIHTLEEPRLDGVEPARLPEENVTTHEEQEFFDNMLIDILIVVQSEMSQRRSITHEVPINQLKKLLAINTRALEVKLFKNILLLKHARLVETCLYDDRSIKSIYIISPVSVN